MNKKKYILIEEIPIKQDIKKKKLYKIKIPKLQEILKYNTHKKIILIITNEKEQNTLKIIKTINKLHKEIIIIKNIFKKKETKELKKKNFIELKIKLKYIKKLIKKTNTKKTQKINNKIIKKIILQKINKKQIKIKNKYIKKIKTHETLKHKNIYKKILNDTIHKI